MLIKTNGVYGAQIAHRTVFSREGALERYKIILEVCYNGLDTASATVLSDAQNDMVSNAGFTWDEVEALETEFLENLK